VPPGHRRRARRRHGIAKITDDLDVLLAFYDHPVEHWVHLRTRIQYMLSTHFATLRHRTRVTKGPGSQAACLAMAFELISTAPELTTHELALK
jgi:putative transposase